MSEETALQKLIKLRSWLEDSKEAFANLTRGWPEDGLKRVVNQWIGYNDIIIERIQPAIDTLEANQ